MRRDQPKTFYAYVPNPWTQTIGLRRPGARVGADYRGSMGEKKGKDVILLTLKIFFNAALKTVILLLEKRKHKDTN